MPVGEKKRTLTNEERIRYEEESRQNKASRGILQARLEAVQDELETAQMQENSLKKQIERIEDQLKSQKENRARQIALQLELNKSLSKTRDAYMKVVLESMASGNLSRMEGLSVIVDETVKEVLALDEMNGPHSHHRCQGMRNTCLDIRTFFPSSTQSARHEDMETIVDPIQQSTCPSYINQGRCFDCNCPYHASGEPRIPPQLEPLPDPMLPDIIIGAAALEEEGETIAPTTTKTTGSTITAWWLEEDNGKTTTVAFNVESVLQALGVCLSTTNTEKLILTRASSETAPATDNIARYVDSVLFGLHAGVITGPFDLPYLVTVLEDLSFPPPLIDRVKLDFKKAASLAWPDYSCQENFEIQVELLRATFAQERSVEMFSNKTEVDETCLDTISRTCKSRKKELAAIESGKTRRIETLAILLPVCRAIIQVLLRAASSIRRGEAGDLKGACHRIDQALLSLLSLSFEDSFSQILLTPLCAANIALACNLKLYQQANSRLESLLNYGRDEEKMEGWVNFFVFSEMLWSQLLQLRMCLPPANVDAEQLLNYKTYLYNFIEDLKINPRHVKPIVGRVK